MSQLAQAITELPVSKPEPKRTLTPAETLANLHNIGQNAHEVLMFVRKVLEGAEDAPKFDGTNMEHKAKCIKRMATALGHLYFSQTGKELGVF